jgi:hypothetical protein
MEVYNKKTGQSKTTITQEDQSDEKIREVSSNNNNKRKQPGQLCLYGYRSLNLLKARAL